MTGKDITIRIVVIILSIVLASTVFLPTQVASAASKLEGCLNSAASKRQTCLNESKNYYESAVCESNFVTDSLACMSK